MAIGTAAGGTSIPRNRPGRTSMSARGSLASGLARVHADVGAHEPQDVEQRRARRVDADVANDERRRSRDHAGGDEECGRREIARESGCPSHAASRARVSQRRSLRARSARRRRRASARYDPARCPVPAHGSGRWHKARQQERGLDLGARHVETVVAADERARPADRDRRPAVARPDAGAHAPQGRGDPLHRPLHQRGVADQRRLERLARQEAGEQSHRRARIAEVERAATARAVRACRPRARRNARAPSRSMPHAHRRQRAERRKAVFALQEAADLGRALVRLRRAAPRDARSTCRPGPALRPRPGHPAS